MKVRSEIWKIIESDPDKDLNFEVGPELVRRFYQWVSSNNLIHFIVLVGQRSILKSRLNSAPRIILPYHLESYSSNEIISLSSSGFSVIWSIGADSGIISSFLRKSGFSIADATTGELEKSTILADSWGVEFLLEGLNLALNFSNGVLCCFSHDAEQVYLFDLGEDQRD